MLNESEYTKIFITESKKTKFYYVVNFREGPTKWDLMLRTSANGALFQSRANAETSHQKRRKKVLFNAQLPRFMSVREFLESQEFSQQIANLNKGQSNFRQVSVFQTIN
jgi:hypothetical protein